MTTSYFPCLLPLASFLFPLSCCLYKDNSSLPFSSLERSLCEEKIVESGKITLPIEMTTKLSQLKWNRSFQQIWGKLTETDTKPPHPLPDIPGQIELSSETSFWKEYLSNLLALGYLYEDFVRLATFNGKLIISEIHLPKHKKTIKPLNAGVRIAKKTVPVVLTLLGYSRRR
jgi:hypothetical protein